MKTRQASTLLAAAALAAASPPLLADADLDTFIHGGSMARPAAATTASAEAVLGGAFDATTASRAEAAWSGAFDSWWLFVADALLNGPFSTFDFPLTFILK